MGAKKRQEVAESDGSPLGPKTPDANDGAVPQAADLKALLAAGVLPRIEELTVIQPPNSDGTARPQPVLPFTAMTEVEIEFLMVFVAQLQRRFPGGIPSWDRSNVEQITARMARAYPNLSLVARGFGLAFDTKGLAAYWKVSERKVRRMIGARELFALRLRSGKYVFPDFQFDENGKVLDGLLDVVDAALPALADPWAVAEWLVTAPSKPSPARLLRERNLVAALERALSLTPASPDEDGQAAEGDPR
jgi:hypothetical protein